MKKVSTIYFCILLATNSVWSQGACITIGGSSDEEGNALLQTSDGGFVIAGMTKSYGAGGMDIYIVKLDSIGALKWTRTIGTGGNDQARAIVQANDGGFVLAGTSNTFAGQNEIYVVKTDNTGVLQWTHTFGESNGDNGFSLVKTSDGGFIVTGTFWPVGAGNSDAYLIKLTGTGTLQWSRVVGGTSNIDMGYSVIQTSDGGYAMAGYTYSFGAGGPDVYVVHTNSTGTVLWTSTIGGAGNDYGYFLNQTADGGYFIAGSTSSFGAGNMDIYLVKLDASGSLQWTRTIGGTGADIAYGATPTSDGGFVITGTSGSFSSGQDIYLIKVNDIGNLLWSRTFGTTGFGNDAGYGVIVTADGKYAIAGTTGSGSGNSSMYFIKTDSSGNACCSSGSGGGTMGSGGTSGTGGTSASGGSSGTGGTASSGGTINRQCGTLSISEVDNANDFFIYPNPNNGKFQIVNDKLRITNIEITNVIGEKIHNQATGNGKKIIDIDLSDQPQGIYFLQLDTNEGIANKKIIITQ